MDDRLEKMASPLPEDAVYWDALANKVAADAEGPLAAYAEDTTWLGVLDRRAPWLVASTLAAVVVLWLVVPEPRVSVGARWIERSLAPDEIAGALVGGRVPPPMDSLMSRFPPPGVDSGEPTSEEAEEVEEVQGAQGRR